MPGPQEAPRSALALQPMIRDLLSLPRRGAGNGDRSVDWGAAGLLRFILVALVMGLGIVSRAAAQTRPAVCGSLPEDIAAVEHFAPYFFDTDMADVRGADIQQLAPTDTGMVVADSATCMVVHERARTYLQSMGDRSVNLESGEYDFTIFRFGPYYAIVLLNNDPVGSTEVKTGYASLLVFRADDLAHVLTLAT